MIDGTGMAVAAVGERLASIRVTQGFVGVIVSAQPAPVSGGQPRVTVRVNGGDEIPLTWISSAVLFQISSGSIDGSEIQIISNSGQWAGIEILTPCGKA